MAFYVGQKVVCIDDSLALDGLRTSLRQNAVYTIRAIDPGKDCNGETGLYLQEVVDAPIRRKFPTGAYRASRFRPVVERKTDISIFTKLLDGIQYKERVK